MNVSGPVPDVGTPVFDANGYINPVWHQFFFTLLRRTGGAEGIDAQVETQRIGRNERRVNDQEAAESSFVSVTDACHEDRIDDVFSHGVQYDPSLHALATILDDGFMSAEDKAQLGGLGEDSTPTFAGVILKKGQVTFPVTQVPSENPNTLDDYEEGDWVPVITFDVPGDLSVSYGTRLGRYTKIGRLISLSFDLATTVFDYSTSTGRLKITGLPFVNSRPDKFVGSLEFQGFNLIGYTQWSATILGAGSAIFFTACASDMDQILTDADSTTSGTDLILSGSITYIV